MMKRDVVDVRVAKLLHSAGVHIKHIYTSDKYINAVALETKISQHGAHALHNLHDIIDTVFVFQTCFKVIKKG